MHEDIQCNEQLTLKAIMRSVLIYAKITQSIIIKNQQKDNQACFERNS